MRASWNVAAGASATASLACIPTWHEDFRQDLARVDVPTLVIYGDGEPYAFSYKAIMWGKAYGLRLVPVQDTSAIAAWGLKSSITPR